MPADENQGPCLCRWGSCVIYLYKRNIHWGDPINLPRSRNVCVIDFFRYFSFKIHQHLRLTLGDVNLAKEILDNQQLSYNNLDCGNQERSSYGA